MTGDADASGLPWLRFGGRRGGNTRGGLLAGEFLLAVPGAELYRDQRHGQDGDAGGEEERQPAPGQAVRFRRLPEADQVSERVEHLTQPLAAEDRLRPPVCYSPALEALSHAWRSATK
jgi:hypothetical protein